MCCLSFVVVFRVSCLVVVWFSSCCVMFGVRFRFSVVCCLLYVFVVFFLFVASCWLMCVACWFLFVVYGRVVRCLFGFPVLAVWC